MNFVQVEIGIERTFWNKFWAFSSHFWLKLMWILKIVQQDNFDFHFRLNIIGTERYFAYFQANG